MGIFTFKNAFRKHALIAASALIICSPQNAAASSVVLHHKELREEINKHTSDKFQEHREWFLETFFEEQILKALMLFTEQMSAVAMQQTMSIGMFLDAKHQLETQRLLQELQIQAHIDYQPSEDFCWFGTNVKSLAASEQSGRDNAYALARRQTARQLGERNMAGASSEDDDKFARWNIFVEAFCDPQDANWLQSEATATGLAPVCNARISEAANADIDYTNSIDSKRTISLLDGFGGFDLLEGGSGTVLYGEQAVMLLQNNLYGHEPPMRITNKARLKLPSYQNRYMELRTITAKRSVAQNSFNAIVGMKSAGSTASYATDTYKFLGALMKELGVEEDKEIIAMIGNEPSYYAQLELLAKRIYQNPDFYANLYDKPANVKRKSVALKAIELMVEREIYESQIRQEMVTSVLLSTRLNTPFYEAEKDLASGGN